MCSKMFLPVTLVGVSVALAVPIEGTVKAYSKHRLVLAYLSSPETFAVAKAFGANGQLDLWTNVPQNNTIMFSVAPEYFSKVESTLVKSNIMTEVLEEDLQKLIDDERSGQVYRLMSRRPFDLRNFETYDQIVASVDYYASVPHAFADISRFVIGKSYESREIIGIKFSNSVTKKPIIFIECGIHAREWASISTCLYMIHQLATNQETHKDLLDRFEFHIVPSANPDGYEYTRTCNRLWRKNRSCQTAHCFGVDLNRNFEAGPHCGLGTESDPCSDIYCGSKPFSEPETMAIRNYLAGIKDRVDYYISIHAFGLAWMFPYSVMYEHCKDHQELLEKAKIGVNAIREKTGTVYKYGPIATTFYRVTGSSTDWAYISLGIKKSYVLEIQPALSAGGRGFLLPKEKIIPVGEETFAGLKAIWLS